MVQKTLYFLLSLFIGFSAVAQSVNERIIASIPDQAATGDQLVYVLTIPEWDKTYSHAEPKIDRQKLSMADSYYDLLMPLGVQVGSGGTKQLVQFDPNNLRFTKTPKYDEFDLIKKNATGEKGLYYSIEENREDRAKTLIRTFSKAGGQKSVSMSEVLASVGRTGSKVGKMSAWLTQDKSHLLIDVEVSTKTLREDIEERLWLTLKLSDLKVKNKLVLNDSDLYSEEGYTLQPLGIDQALNYNIYSRFAEGSPLVSPGTDLVYARYRNNTFKLNWTVNVSVNMRTGEIRYLNPPGKGTNASPKAVLQNNAPANVAAQYAAPFWLTFKYERFKNNAPLEEFEELIYYSEKDKTYMTWSHLAVPEESGFQQVFKNSKGEILNRIPEKGSGAKLNMSKYTIRKMGTNEVVSEYVLINSLAHKISRDGQYMVSVEGGEQVLTLRERKSGKIVDIAPRARMIYVYENPAGFIVKHKLQREIGYALLNDPKNEMPTTNAKTVSTGSVEDKSDAEWEKYQAKFDAFPYKFYGKTADEGHEFMLAMADENALKQAKWGQDVGALIIKHSEEGKEFKVYYKLSDIKSIEGTVIFQSSERVRRGWVFGKVAHTILQLTQQENPSQIKIITYGGASAFSIKKPKDLEKLKSENQLIMTLKQ